MALRALAISGLQSAGVILLTHLSPYALVTSLLINWLWIGNTRDSVDYRLWPVRLAYAVGGACGAGLSLLLARWIG